MVSYTTTIEAGWGTGIMVPEYGFLLNNELTDFNFGFNLHPRIGGLGANDVEGGKRPRSSMTPTILFKGRKPIAAFGSPGGATIISSVYNVLINLVDHGMTMTTTTTTARNTTTSRARETSFFEIRPQDRGFAHECRIDVAPALGQRFGQHLSARVREIVAANERHGHDDD